VTDSVHQNDHLFSTIDLRGFLETLRLRWWIIPAVIAVVVGFLWAQESDLKTEPGSYFVSRTYEGRDATAVLASVGIDPVSVRPFPDANSQLLVLQSAEVRGELGQRIKDNVTVNVARSKPTFSLIETLESDGQSSFVFQSAGTPTYSFSCTAPVKADCEVAIDIYVEKAAQLRHEALTAGLSDLRAVLLQVKAATNDSSVSTKIAAVDALLGRLSAPLVRVASSEMPIGPTVTNVQRPTYAFGIVAGLLVSLLILLQLTYSDSRVRSLRQLARLVGADAVLGSTSTNSDEARDRRVAISLRHAMGIAAATTVRYLPLRTTGFDPSILSRIANLAGSQFDTALPFATIEVSELTSTPTIQIDVIVVQKNLDLRKDVVEAFAAMRRSGRPLAGAILLE
jgi:hypothetical protein